MPKVAVPGGEISYEEAGEGHPLVFVSGLNGVARYWQPQMAHFAERFRVIAYDQRGTGASDCNQRQFSVDGMATDLVALINERTPASATLVATSVAAPSSVSCARTRAPAMGAPVAS